MKQAHSHLDAFGKEKEVTIVKIAWGREKALPFTQLLRAV